ncbi:uncharacterized protein MYCFIDRAFT_210714 [Pseudocercospora fijiensis CIRAD86]|uniref:Uncharacterized protein n=1 Tax=Pseudocercospora fijiensis (strain CIRAD86) TaxID=383855 RepID=M3B385_PSEFD|nr:uncharacterized protein MYCFIDRAFT_210714 [Pseudocercospora fijiensis CIRAD86]EME83843.1 hypothetical protein MYCFIDRAFT_210714 [Pseudocercospora fijiensis CIRAD86]
MLGVEHKTMAAKTHPSELWAFVLSVGAGTLRTILQWLALCATKKGRVAFQEVSTAFRYVDGVATFGESTRRGFDFSTHRKRLWDQERGY